MAAYFYAAKSYLQGSIGETVELTKPSRFRVAQLRLGRIQSPYRWQVVVRSAEAAALRAALAAMQAQLGGRAARGGVLVGIDIDPVNML
jgi:primosomal protein N'